MPIKETKLAGKGGHVAIVDGLRLALTVAPIPPPAPVYRCRP